MYLVQDNTVGNKREKTNILDYSIKRISRNYIEFTNDIVSEKHCTPAYYNHTVVGESYGGYNIIDVSFDKDYFNVCKYDYTRGKVFNKYVKINRKNVPKYLKEHKRGSYVITRSCNSKKVLHFATKYDCDYMFSHIIHGSYQLVETNVDVHGQSCPGLLVPLDDCKETAVYIKCNIHCCRRIKTINYVVATNMNNIVRDDVYAPIHPRTIFNTFKNYNDFNNICSYENITEAIRSSKIPEFCSSYHENITVDDICNLLERIPEHDKVALYKFNFQRFVQLGRPFIIGLILYLLNTKVVYHHILLCRGINDICDAKTFIEFGKELSNTCKFLQNIVFFDLLPLFEFHVIINRTYTPIDWNKERENRQKPNTVDVPYDFIYEECRKIFEEAKINNKYKFKKLTWDEYWSNRFEYTSGGAFYSQYTDDSKYLDNNRDFKNKLFAVLAMENSISMKDFLRRNPCVRARASVKYEWSKQRAIYGCDITSFIITQFVMSNCEDAFNLNCISGKDMNADTIFNRLKTILNEKEPLCLDFEDFNSQHTFSSMKAVVHAFRDTHFSEMTDEQKEAIDWVYHSISNSIVEDNLGCQQVYTAKGTLFSGWRLTTFINTALNYAYFKFINRVNINRDFHSHSGDDSIIGITRIRQYQSLIANSLTANIRFSTGKCHFGSIAEFLRIDYRNRNTGQYLPRSIATSVLARVESDRAYDIKEKLTSILERCAAVVSRTGNLTVMNQLAHILCTRAQVEMTNNKIDYMVLLNTNCVNGGMSDRFESRFDIDIKKLSINDMNNLGIVHSKDLPEKQLHGISAYVGWLVARFPSYKINKKHLKEKIYDTLIYSYAKIPSRYRFRHITSGEEILSRRKLYGIRKAYSEEIKKVDYGRSKMVGRLIDILQTCRETQILAKIVEKCQDKLSILNVII